MRTIDELATEICTLAGHINAATLAVEILMQPSMRPRDVPAGTPTPPTNKSRNQTEIRRPR